MLPATDVPLATLARDALGRWLVVFATARYDVNHTQLQGYLAPRARPLAADLTPSEPSFDLAAPGVGQVVSALLPSGSFVNAWTTAGAPGDTRGYANVVSLCTPDVHVCGDGVLDPALRGVRCRRRQQRHDLDACRTSCMLPSCGDGVADGGEACDDGTVTPCDGCDASCQPVAGLTCGDGIVVAGCADQCDDGNAVVGDGCAPMCTLERVPGGGSATTDCLSEWIVTNPSNLPLVDGHGRMRRTQRCVDDDPACDFDGGMTGACTFHLQVCANNGDLTACTPTALAGWDLTKPSSKQAARHPELAAVRTAWSASPPRSPARRSPTRARGARRRRAAPGIGPQYGTGKVSLAATATAPSGLRDKDGLKLICAPH